MAQVSGKLDGHQEKAQDHIVWIVCIYLLSRLMVKMDVVDHLVADIVNIKETLSQIAPKDPYLNALSKGL